MASYTTQEEFIEHTEKLYALREKGVKVSSLTSELISFESIEPQIEYFNKMKNCMHVHKNYITCMVKINKNLDEEKAVQHLIVGTEHNQLLILEPNGQQIKLEI